MHSIPFVPSDASPFLLLWVIFLGFLGAVLVAHVVFMLIRLALRLRIHWLLKDHYRSR